MRPLLILCASALLLASLATTTTAVADHRDNNQSTTGPVPPPGVILSLSEDRGDRAVVIDGVPGYFWRHGCGPTALGMIVGYYDMHGYPDLFRGDSSTQTADVDQLIASQRGTLDPGHYEDYSCPRDSLESGIIADMSEPPAGDEHRDDCIADFMKTSFSARSNYYGWSWGADMGPAFEGFVEMRLPDNRARYQDLNYPTELTWDVLVENIDDNRPMVFLVDTNQDGSTDHFVAVVGYRDDTVPEYGCLTTWWPPDVVQWHEFRGMSTQYNWGVASGWAFDPNSTVVVDGDGGGDFTTIGEAVEASNDATIIVNPGTYSGTGNYGIDLAGKDLTIRSAAGPESTVIDCGGSGRAFNCSNQEGPSTIIDGFTIRNGAETIGGAIRCHWNSSPVLRNLVIEDCTATVDGGGIYCSGGAAPDISNVTINRCSAVACGGGICCRNASPTIRNVTLYDNSAPSGGGVYVFGSSSPLITNTAIAGSADGEGVACDAVGTPEVTRSCIYGNAGGDTPCGTAYDNIFTNPLFCDIDVYDLSLRDDSPCLPGNNVWNELIGANGAGSCPTGIASDDAHAGTYEGPVLHGGSPNPFGPSTTVRYELPHEAHVTLSVYDASGRLVQTLVRGTMGPGVLEQVWNGTDSRGRPAAAGVYFLKLEVDGVTATGKLALLR